MQVYASVWCFKVFLSPGVNFITALTPKFAPQNAKKDGVLTRLSQSLLACIINSKLPGVLQFKWLQSFDLNDKYTILRWDSIHCSRVTLLMKQALYHQATTSGWVLNCLNFMIMAFFIMSGFGRHICLVENLLFIFFKKPISLHFSC